jgi:AcrR family transcriptional regulator
LPRAETAFEEIRDRTSKKILEAASRVFSRKGLEATMAEIAAEAVVSQGLAYRYFPSKEAIFYTLARQIIRSGGLLAASKTVGTARDRLEYMMAEAIRKRKENPEFFQFLFQALREEKLPKDIHEMLDVQGRSARKAIRQLIVEGQTKGELSKEDDPGEIADFFLDYLGGLSMRIASARSDTKIRVPSAKIALRVLGPDTSRQG